MPIRDLPKYLTAATEIKRHIGKIMAVVVRGLPGAGKTRSIVSMIPDIMLHSGGKIIFAEPRRQLRHWLFNEIKKVYPNVFEMKAKDEFFGCPLYGKKYTSFIDYIMECARCGAGKSCPFKSHIKEFYLKYRDIGVVVTTHLMLPLTVALAGKHLGAIIIDEAEEFIFSMSDMNITEEKLAELEGSLSQLDEHIREKLRKFIDMVRERWYYDAYTRTYYFDIKSLTANLIVLLSATWTTAFEPIIHKKYIIGPYYAYVQPKKIAKQIIIHNRYKLTENKLNEWLFEYAETIANITKISVEIGKTIGIVTRKNEFADRLVNYLVNKGIDAYCGDDYHEARRHDVVIIVPANKLFRGLSLDRDVVICDYQHHEFRFMHPRIVGMSEFYCGTSPIEFHHLLTQAQNVQAYFRFIRIHDKQHIIICVDARAYTAIRKYFEWYVKTHCISQEATSLSEIQKLFIQNIEHMENQTLQMVHIR